MKKYTTIKQSWDDYDARVVPINAGDVQRRECKLAFYGGAATTLSLLIEMTDENLSEQQSVARLSILHGECEQWLEEIKKEMK